MTDIVSWCAGLLGLTSGGILFYKANRLKADSEGRQSKAQAELEEANVYKSRIKSLGEEVEALEAKVKSLREQLEEMTNQRDKLLALSATQDITLAQLEEKILAREAQNKQLMRENRTLKGHVTRLKNLNARYEAELGKTLE